MEKIMLIDDDQALLQMMRELLSNTYEVVMYWDPRLAKRALEAPGGLPKTIIMDVMMPGVDGLTLVNELRENDRTCDIPIITISANKNMIDLFRGLPNVFAFVEKPFDLKLLSHTVAEAVRKSS